MNRLFSIGRSRRSPNKVLCWGMWWYPTPCLDWLLPWITATEAPGVPDTSLLSIASLIPDLAVAIKDRIGTPVLSKVAYKIPIISDIDNPY